MKKFYFFIFSWWYGFQCFFGGAGCSATSGVRGTIFILMYVLSYVGSANLLRHAEGATWLAIVVVSDLVFVCFCLINLNRYFYTNLPNYVGMKLGFQSLRGH